MVSSLAKVMFTPSCPFHLSNISFGVPAILDCRTGLLDVDWIHYPERHRAELSLPAGEFG